MIFSSQKLSFILYFIFLEITVTTADQLASGTCGYRSCSQTQPDKLNIHLVPHTHDDVGWLKTVEQYFYGTRQEIQDAKVQLIIDSVIEALETDPTRRFIYVEMAYLWMWWTEADEQKRAALHKLVQEGRLEMIGGAWSMNDEATTHYNSIIDQFSWGFRRLSDTFGKCARPKIGWQIDPFGHSREQASIFAQLGFDGVFLGRIDFQDKEQRLETQRAEFVWRGSPKNLGATSDIFTAINYNLYQAPPGFCFDKLCSDQEITPKNAKERAQELIEYFQKQATSYNTNNVLATLGGDFTYMDADRWYKNYDQLIEFIRADSKLSALVHIFYSTPSCYIKALNQFKNITWTTKDDDFFPYASGEHSYWTGYYTSRPTIKYFERLGNNYLQVTKHLAAAAGLNHSSPELNHFRETMGVLQHHDAITGTEKQHVADDYSRLLHESFLSAKKINGEALNKLMKVKNEEKIRFETCQLLNISICEHTFNNKQFLITVYNPTSQYLTSFIRVPVSGQYYTVRNPKGYKQVNQILPIHSAVQAIPGRYTDTKLELVFRANKIPPLGYQSFLITEIPENKGTLLPSEGGNTIEKKSIKVKLTEDHQLTIESTSNRNRTLTQSFYYYLPQERISENDPRTSGAYIFRPRYEEPKKIPPSSDYKVFKGPLVEEIHQTFNPWVSQVVRLYDKADHIELNWLIGPIPVEDDEGKEIVTRYRSQVHNNGEFYTDSNGRESMRRKLNFRASWSLNSSERVPSNYYPVTTKISINDSNSRLSVFTDRSEGGTSLEDGEIELMLHRRLLRDDYFGVGEALNEIAYGEEGIVVRGKHYVVFSSSAETTVEKEKELAAQLALQPWLFITPLSGNVSWNEWSQKYPTQGSILKRTLPKNVKILTLEPWNDSEILLRLEHMYEKSEHRNYSAPARVHLHDLFHDMMIASVREMTLDGNQLKSEATRLRWNYEQEQEPESSKSEDNSAITDDGRYSVILQPMEIRTFVAEVVRKSG